MEKRLLGLVTLVLLGVLLAAPCLALDEFEVNVEPVRAVIFTEGEDITLANLTVRNNLVDDVDFEIGSPNFPDWDFYTIPRERYLLAVDGNGSRSVMVAFRPLHVGIGSYRLMVDVKSRTSDKKITKIFNVDYLEGTPPHREYLPDVRISAEIPTDEVDPREPFIIRVKIKNNNNRDVENLNLVISTKKVSKQLTLSLEPNQEKTENIILELNPYETPKKDALNVVGTYITQDETFTWEIMPLPFEIMAYSDLDIQREEKKGFLSKTITITYENLGNTDRTTHVRHELSPLTAFFTKTEPEAEHEKGVLFWNINLRARKDDRTDSVTINITHNYRSLLYLVILIAVLIFGYFRYRTPIVITKTITDVRKTSGKAGGIHRMKVTIHLRNRTKKPYEQLKITDRVPNITEVEGEFDVGTLKPRVLKHHKRGTMVVWEIHSIEPFEERIITYQLHSTLHIVGGIELPATRVMFKDHRGATVLKKSNKAFFSE